MTENIIPPVERLECLLEEAGLHDYIIKSDTLHPFCFHIDFSRPMTTEDVTIILSAGATLSTVFGLEEETTTCRVTVPSSWLSDDTCDECGAPTSPQQNNLCEKCRMREADIATAEAAFYEASIPADPELTATAQEIKRLQSIIDDQRQQLVRANTRADNAEAARDDYLERLDTITEKYKAAQILLEGIVAPKSREVCTLVQPLTMTGQRISADKELAERLNEGWEVLNITITSVPLNDEGQEMLTRIVTLSRECPTPHKEMPTVQHGTILIQSAPFTPLKPAPAITATSRFAQMKAESDARVEAAAPYSPLTTAVVNYLKVGL